MMGEQIRYVAEADGEWIGLLGWSSASLSSAPRRRWIGWNLSQERQRLHLVAHNARFLIRGQERVPNLASRILGLCTARLRGDWMRSYRHDLLVAETFVDASRYRGTCYRAAGWTELGQTQGSRRVRVGYQAHGDAKVLLMKELVPGGRGALCADHHANDRGAFLTLSEIALAGEDGLLAFLRRHIPDPRSMQGRSFHGVTLLGIIVVGMLTGHRTLGRIGRWMATLDQSTLASLYCPRGADGRWKPPCTNSLRYMLQDIDPQVFEQVVSAWLRQRGLLGRVSAVSIGRRSHPEPGPQGRPSPWHLRWGGRKRVQQTSAMDDQVAAAEAVAQVTSVVTL